MSLFLMPLLRRTCFTDRTRILNHRVMLLLCLLSAACPATATDTLQYDIKQYTDENGLPQNSIKAIASDPLHFLWLATENGLVRFDGRQFKTFHKDELPAKSSRMSVIQRDFNTGALYALSIKQDYISIHDGRLSLEQVSPGEMTLVPALGSYWYAFGFMTMPAVYKNLVQDSSYVMQAGNKQFYYVTKYRISFFSEQQVLFSIPFAHTTWKFFMAGGSLYYTDEASNYWRIADGRVQAVRVNRFSGERSATVGDHQVFTDPIAGDAFLYHGQNLYLLEPQPDGSLNARLLASFNFEENNIMSVHYDRDYGRIFLGSRTRGLFVLTPKHFQSLKANNNSGEQNFYSQAWYKDRYVLTGRGSLLAPGMPPRILPLVYSLNDNMTLLKDHRGFIWVKGYDRLYKVSENGQRVIQQWALPGEITQLYQGSDSCIWIGTRKYGLFRLQDGAQQPECFNEHCTEVAYLQYETSDLLWVGTGYNLFRFHLADKRVDTIFDIKEEKYIRSIYVRQADEIWFTVADEGLYLYSKGRVTRFPPDRNNYLSAAHCVLEDQQGFFWISSNKGLFQVAREDLLTYARHQQPAVYYYHYTRDAGFSTNEFNGGCTPCGLRLSPNDFSLPSFNGLVRFNPLQVKAELPVYPMLVDYVKLDETLLPSFDTIRTQRNFKQLDVAVVVPYFGNEQNLQIVYALVNGGDTVWRSTPINHVISFGNLPAGRYELLLQKRNGFGHDAYEMKKFVLLVPQAWYETAWFYIGLVVLFVIGWWLISQLRVKQVQEKNRQLEKRIGERTWELREALETLKQSENRLRRQTHIQKQLLTAMSHDIKSPLKYIVLTARNIWAELAARDTPQELRHAAYINYDALYKVYHFTDKLLPYIKVHANEAVMHWEKVPLAKLVEETLSVFQHIVKDKDLVIENEIPDDAVISSNYQLLGVVVHNLIDNASKYTMQGSIRIGFEQRDGLSVIRISDTGIGMKPAILEWCNQPAPSVQPEDNTDALTLQTAMAGIGLVIVKELLVLLKARLVVSNNEGGGTTMEIRFEEMRNVE